MKLSSRAIGWLTAGVTAVAIGGVLLAPELGSRIHTGANAAPAEPRRPSVPEKTRESANESRPVRVTTIRPTRRNLKRLTTQPAQVEPHEKTQVFAKASGFLAKFGTTRDQRGATADIDLGSAVHKDQVLAELWIPEMDQEKIQKEALREQARSEVAQADASLKTAEAMQEAARAKLQESKADVERYQAEVRWRKSEHSRFDQLSRDRAVPQAQVDEKLNALRAAEASRAASRAAVLTAEANINVECAQVIKARADVESAASRLKVAEANLQQTLVMLDYARIRAPFDGVITRRWVDTGAFVQSAASGRIEPLFTIVRVDLLRIVVDVPETDAPWVRIGQPANLVVDAVRGRDFPGKVVRIADALDPATRTMRVEVELDQPAGLLRPGMFGSVTVTLGEVAGALMLPAGVLVSANGQPGVFVVDAGRARRQEVQLGMNDGVEMQIIGGLTGDEQVILDGKNLVREGQSVQPVN